MGCDFRVGFGLQFNARVFNFFPKGGEVFNDAVVDDGDFVVVGQVRVSINIVGSAVRCPAGVPNSCGAGEVIRTDVVDSGTQVIQLSCFFLYVDGAPAVEDGDPRGVIPPVFHPLKSRKGNVEGLFTANVLSIRAASSTPFRSICGVISTFTPPVGYCFLVADKLSSLVAHLDKRGPHRVLVGDLDYVGIPGKVYLPADGNNVPGVVFGHDWMTDISAYHGTLRHLASWGIAVAAPDSETGFKPNPGAFANDLMTCMSVISGVQMGQGSITVHPEKLVLAGHGFGASAAVLAAAGEWGSSESSDSEVAARSVSVGSGSVTASATPGPKGLTSVAAVFPRSTSPQASDAASNIEVPGLILAPGQDSVLIGDESLRIAAKWKGDSYYRRVNKASQSVMSEKVVKNMVLGLGSPGFSQRATLRGLLVAFVRATAEGDKKYSGVLSNEDLKGTEFWDRDHIANELPENADVMERLRDAL